MNTVIFDLDGTLVDSAPGIIASLTHAVRALGHDFMPFAGIERLLGPPMVNVVSQLLEPYRDDRVALGVVHSFSPSASDGPRLFLQQMHARSALPAPQILPPSSLIKTPRRGIGRMHRQAQ